ncbi:MAG: GNAT family N-acetyltransferase [Pseudomonadales bacterium]|nr:GNAT family N-acetyltransferase [Pseudomonadales bacterium]
MPRQESGSFGLEHESTIRIRAARSDDVEELSVFARATFETAFLEGMGEDRLRQHVKEEMSDQCFKVMLQQDDFYLAFQDDRLIGFVQIGSVNEAYKPYLQHYDADAQEVRRLYVLAKRQGAGIGSALLEIGLQAAAKTKSETIYLTTWESNAGAQRLYHRFGFRKVGEIPEFDQNDILSGYEYILAHRMKVSPE